MTIRPPRVEDALVALLDRRPDLWPVVPPVLRCVIEGQVWNA